MDRDDSRRRIIRGRRRPNSKIGRLRAALLERIVEHEAAGALPTSGRFLFYELVPRVVIPKHSATKRRPDQDMTDALTQLREDGDVPWEWIVDETRSIDVTYAAPTVREWLRGMVDQARLDPWAGQPPVIITESRSLAGVLRDLANEYAVSLASTNGQIGRGHLRAVKKRCGLTPGSPVLYLGDLDLAGGQIESNTRRVLSEEVGAELDWRRIAITHPQVDQYDLEPIVKNDRRYKDAGPHEAVETEALSQSVIVQLVRAALDDALPEPLEAVLERERRERADARHALEEM